VKNDQFSHKNLLCLLRFIFTGSDQCESKSHSILFYEYEPISDGIRRIKSVLPFFPNDSPCSDYDMQTPDSYHHLCNDIPSISDLQT